MRVVADLHHGVLWEALAILFSDRYGWELVAWADGHYQPDRGLSKWTTHADFPPRSVQVVSTDWIREHGAQLLVATVGANRQPMKALAAEIGAIYLDHVGNAWDEPIGEAALRSVAGSYGIPYHPEFHRVPYRPPNGNRIGAFHGSLAVSACRTHWDRAMRDHSEYDFQLYGTTANPLFPYQVAGAMADCLAIWHDKDADGYGFTVHEAFASGRAVIGHGAHYTGKFAAPLFVRGVTYLEPEDELRGLVDIGLAARERFAALVDFDAEAAAIRAYLEVLLQ